MIPAPKEYRANAAYRAAILRRANQDEAFQQECWIRASRDIVWFTDTFCWTFSPKDYPDFPNRPFILYPYQEEALHKMVAGIGHHDILLEKSRDMGATWLALLSIYWRWQFFSRQSFLLGSRVENLVDKPGDPKSLFWKLDYLMLYLPGWLRPPVTRTKLHLANEDNNSTIDGESTNDDFARGDRRTAILLDEFPAVDNGYLILNASRDATKCRFLNGTPQGASGAYYDRREIMVRDAPERVIRLHWSLHPDKAKGLYTTEGNVEGGRLNVIDTSYVFSHRYPYVLDGKLRSPWYDNECSRAANPQEIAQELDIDYAASGWPFFERKVLDKLIEDHARTPFHSGELFTAPGAKPEWIEGKGARLRLWTHPDAYGVIESKGRYTVGCDIATGKGGEMSSNSVASIGNKLTGEKVGEFVTNAMNPSEFCEYAVGICRWFNDAFLIWEENGPGGEFTTRLKELKYRNFYFRDDDTGVSRKKTKKPGWWSTKDNKRNLIAGYYRQGLLGGRFINRSTEALNECGEYVHQPNGEIIHVRSKNTIDPTATGAEHGDRVIADALAFKGFVDVALPEEEAVPEAPDHSFLGRRLLALQKTLTAKFY